MKIAVMGTGDVGQTLATALVRLGHEVTIAGRDASNPAARDWADAHGARHGDYAGAAAWAETVLFAVQGSALLQAADAAGADNLAGKLVIDVTNPLDMSRGFPPSMIADLSNTHSAAEALQTAHPRARVVKTLNTMSNALMVAPDLVPGPHDVFLCGNDTEAKAEAKALLAEFGWHAPIDLGDLTAARGMEGLMLMWLRLYQHFGDARFNWHIAR